MMRVYFSYKTVLPKNLARVFRFSSIKKRFRIIWESELNRIEILEWTSLMRTISKLQHFLLLLYTGFIRSGKIRGKHIFFELVRESQGESGKVREFNEKVREKLEKVREIFLESSYLLWIKIHCFLRYNQSFLRYNYDRSPVKFLFLLLNWCFCVCMH